MHRVLVQEIRRRNPFRIYRIPWMARVYAFPFEHYASLGKQALFGAPNFILFLLFQKLPFGAHGQFGFKLENGEKPIRFNAKNTQFSALYLKSFAAGYEPQITALIDLLSEPDTVFYDIGSNWGWFSLFLASKPGFRGRIHAFEPFPSSYQDLTSMVTQAGIQNLVQCHNVALSDKPGKTAMRLPDHFQSGQAVMEGSDSSNSQVAMAPLDSLQLEPPSLIKMDVEGSEIKVFRGSKGVISKYKPMIVFENSRSPHAPMKTMEPLFYLRDLGYSFFHAAWLRRNGTNEFLVGDDADPDPQEQEMLALVNFEPNERLLRPDGINIFACHRERLEQLGNKFRVAS
jgi:FkbM family methyltransferase